MIIVIAIVCFSGIATLIFFVYDEYSLATIFGIVFVILATGFFVTSTESNINQSELQLMELSTVTTTEYDEPTYVIGSMSSNGIVRVYQFWYKDANGLAHPCSVPMRNCSFEFESKGHIVIVQETETVKKYYHLIPSKNSETNIKYHFIVPERSIIEIYDNLK